MGSALLHRLTGAHSVLPGAALPGSLCHLHPAERRAKESTEQVPRLLPGGHTGPGLAPLPSLLSSQNSAIRLQLTERKAREGHMAACQEDGDGDFNMLTAAVKIK